MPSKSSSLFLIFLIISSSFAFKNDYELLLTYRKYLKVMRTSQPGTKFSLIDMLQTTSQRCMKIKLNIRDSSKIPDSEIERKVFSMARVVNGKSREMKEAYAVMLAAPLCNVSVDDYFRQMFEELMALFRSDFYEENLECFRNFDVQHLRAYDDECIEVFGEFTKNYYLDQIDYVRKLIDNHDYPYCIENIAIKNAMYNYKAVVYANTDPYDFNRFEMHRDKFVDMMKESTKDALDCILMDLNLRKIEKLNESLLNQVRGD